MKVNLWFARDEQNEIVSIVDSTNENTYTCPICSSKVIPKALESKKVTPHYAHVDVDKCNSESMIHWWFKHKFIERGDVFKIKTDSEIEYTCKDFNTEVAFQLDSGTYRPDLVIYTECGQEIVFEMANTNKKKVQDYIDKWIELDKIVVEVDIKALQNVNEIKVFSALYYNGKCFNFNKRDGGYYNAIGKLKEQMKQDNSYDIELVKKLDWFWYEVVKYETDTSQNTEEIINILKLLDSSIVGYLSSILKKRKSYVVIKEYYRREMELHKKSQRDKNQCFIDKYFNFDKINNYFKQHSKEYRLTDILFINSGIFMSFAIDTGKKQSLKIKVDKNTDKNSEYIISQLANRIAYQEIKNNLKPSIIELNNKFNNLKFSLEYHRQGFDICAINLLSNKRYSNIYFESTFYSEMYSNRKLYLSKEIIVDRISKKIMKG